MLAPLRNEVEHSGAPDTITVRARSAAMTNGMQERREKSWHKQTIATIVQTIAKRYSLTPTVGDKLAKIQIAHIDQTHESDMSFLTRLAKRYDAVVNVKDKRLLFMPIGAGKTSSGKALKVLNLTRADGDTHRYHVSERENYSATWHGADFHMIAFRLYVLVALRHACKPADDVGARSAPSAGSGCSVRRSRNKGVSLRASRKF